MSHINKMDYIIEIHTYNINQLPLQGGADIGRSLE